MLLDFWESLLSPYASGNGKDWFRILGLGEQEIVILSLVIFAILFLVLAILGAYLSNDSK